MPHPCAGILDLVGRTLPCLMTRMRPTSLDVSALERIQTHVRLYAAERREVKKIGPFLATFGRHSNGPYLNYAVPDDWSEPTPGQILALVRAYEKRRPPTACGSSSRRSPPKRPGRLLRLDSFLKARSP